MVPTSLLICGTVEGPSGLAPRASVLIGSKPIMSITRTNETSIYLSRICPLGVHTKTNMGWTGLHKLVVKWRSDRGIFNEVLASDVIDNGVLARKFLAI